MNDHICFGCPCITLKAAQVDALVELVRHTWIHSGYRNCGYAQMTTKQQQLFDDIVRSGEEKADG